MKCSKMSFMASEASRHARFSMGFLSKKISDIKQSGVHIDSCRIMVLGRLDIEVFEDVLHGERRVEAREVEDGVCHVREALVVRLDDDLEPLPPSLLSSQLATKKTAKALNSGESP